MGNKIDLYLTGCGYIVTKTLQDALIFGKIRVNYKQVIVSD